MSRLIARIGVRRDQDGSIGPGVPSRAGRITESVLQASYSGQELDPYPCTPSTSVLTTADFTSSPSAQHIPQRPRTNIPPHMQNTATVGATGAGREKAPCHHLPSPPSRSDPSPRNQAAISFPPVSLKSRSKAAQNAPAFSRALPFYHAAQGTRSWGQPRRFVSASYSETWISAPLRRFRGGRQANKC